MNDYGKTALATFHQKKPELQKLLEDLYLCVLAVYLAKSFLDTTLFSISFPWWNHRILTRVLLVIGLARFCALKGWRDKSWLLCGVLAFCIAIPRQTCGYTFLMELALLLFAAVRIPYKKILRVYVYCNGILLFVTVLGALAGSVRDLLYYSHNMFRHAFGICFPTDFSAHVVFLLLAAWVLYENIPKWVFAVAAFGAGAFVYHFCSARNSAIVLFAMGCGILFLALLQKWNQKPTCAGQWIQRLFDAIQVISLPTFAAVMVGLTACYQQDVAWIGKLNTLLSSRLSLGYQAMQTYGIKLFGNAFEMVGAGGDTVSRVGYNFIDSSYCLVLIRYGFVPFVAVCVLFFCGALRGKNQKRYLLALAMVALHNMVEHHLLEVTYNIFILTAFTEVDTLQIEERPSCALKRAEKIALGGLALGVAALFPWMLDYLRTIVTLLHLNVTGRRELFILGILAGLALAGSILWAAHKLLHLSKQEEKRKRTMLRGVLAGSWILLCVMCLCAEKVIRNGMRNYSEYLDLGVAVIELLAGRDEADAPAVYVEDVPELYRRRTNLLSRRILSPSSAVDEKAVILTGIGQDYYYLTQSSYQFAELSEIEGLYTNDETLIQQLNEKGTTTLSKAYTVRNAVDLWWLAGQNGLEADENGHLILQGADHSLIHGPYVTIYQGQLRVQYKLHLVSAPSSGNKVGTLRVSASWGQTIYQEVEIFAENFDENGDAAFTVDASISASEGMEFLIFLESDAVVEVEEITYGKVEPGT